MNTKLVSSIEAITRSRLVTIGTDALLTEAAKLLSHTQISLLVVCNSDGTMAGVITKTNIVRRVGHASANACMTAAVDLMTRDVTYCRSADSISDVLSMMQKGDFVHLPVVDDTRKPLGVLNARDGFRALLADEQYEESLLRNYVMGVGYR